jgi:hypothetical protein
MSGSSPPADRRMARYPSAWVAEARELALPVLSEDRKIRNYLYGHGQSLW